MIDKMLASKARLTPETGYNLVGVDAFETEPGEELYLIDSFTSKSAAEKAKSEFALVNPKEVTYIYPAPGET